ncbi:MAG: dihydrolipoyl dehydrogenase [Euryarchaeota archaeon]|nr:dihydrolipoyl dehydrogenase [Euryarchaeota archaeon]
MPKKTDTVVIGAGPGGYVAAIRLGQLGVKTLIIEKEYYGGVCLNVGCIPSKALITAAKTYKKIQTADTFGISVQGAKVDAKKMQEFKEGVVKKLTGGVKQLLKGNGVELMEGTARFTGKNTLEVKTKDGKESVEFKHAIIATGSRPIQIHGFEFDEKQVLSSTGALALTKVPKKLVIIGGGYIGLEIGCMYNNLGTEVTVVEMMDQLLPGTDEEVVKTLHRLLKKKGMDIHLEHKAAGIKKGKDGVTVTVEGKDGKKKEIKGDHVLVAVGRRPNTEELGLDRAGVKTNDKGLIKIDDKARSNVQHIFAIGDIVPGMALAHKASKEGTVAAEVIAGKKGASLDHKVVPAAVFTDPEIAYVGLDEKQAKKEGRKVKVGKFMFGANGRALGAAEAEGFVKIVADEDTGEVLGVQIIGPDASDLIAEPTLGIEMGAYTDDIGLTIHTHPTLAEAIHEAAEAAEGHAIHAMNK